MTDAYLFHLLVEPQRRPHLAAIDGEIEIRRHHSDDGIRFRVERQRPAHDFRIRAESALPQTVLEHDHLIAPRLVFAWQKCATDRRLDAERIEEAGGDAITAESFWLMRASQVEVAP